MAFLNLELPNESRDALKKEAKRQGMRFYPFCANLLIKEAERLEKKEKQGEK